MYCLKIVSVQRLLGVLMILLLIGCGRKERGSRFTEAQVKSLALDKTRELVTKSDSVIKVDLHPFLGKKGFDFGTLVNEVKLIPLETKKESLVGAIIKVVVTKSHIYIMDKFKGQGLVVFDREGRFIKRLSHGQGPGEVFRLYDFSYDEQNNKLILYQHSFMMTFTADGKYINQKRLPLGFYNFVSIKDGYLLKTLDRIGNEHLGNLKDNTLIVVDKDFKIEAAGLNHLPYGKAFSGYFYLYKNEDIISITESYVDTIYQYEEGADELKAKYVMDYSEKRLPQEFVYSNTWEKFENVTQNNDYYYYIGEYLETKTKNLFLLRNDYIGLRTMVYRDKSSGNMEGGTYANYNLTEIPPISFPIGAFKDYFISIHEPNKLDTQLYNSAIISKEDKEKLKKLKDQDNPMLIFFKMKNF